MVGAEATLARLAGHFSSKVKLKFLETPLHGLLTCNTENMPCDPVRCPPASPLRIFAVAFPATAAVLMAFAPSTYALDPLLHPTFTSEVLAPQPETVLPLLKVVCGEGVRTVTAKGQKALGCGDASMAEILASGQRRYPWMPYVLWEADGIIFGHFLSATSEDAAISCFACEGHPWLWGGTLLLTKQSGKWRSVWYRPGVLTRHCRRVSFATGRQILFCEETDGGMGHDFHGLYIVDFVRPEFAWDSVILMADSYRSFMLGGVQMQHIDRVSFDQTANGGLMVRVFAQSGRIKLHPDDQDRLDEESLPKPKISKYEIDFRLDGDRFKVTPETAAVGRLFGVK
jgi:hypothetical protein